MLIRHCRKLTFVSVLNTGWELASGGYFDCTPAYRRKQQWKITFYVILNPFFAGRWFRLFKSPNFNAVSFNRPRLYIKPFKPYISIKWSKKRKLKVILDTYRFIENTGGVFKQFLVEKEGIIIAKVNIGDRYDGVIKLNYIMMAFEMRESWHYHLNAIN